MPTTKTSAQASVFSTALCAHPAGFAYHLSRGRWIPAPHLQLISFHLARAAAGRGRRILIATPPRHGKSLLTSVWTPAWFLSLWPYRRVMLCSYEAGVATDWGRQVRNLLDEHAETLGVTLAKDSKAAGRWNTAQGGGMTCAGVGGPITGRGADLLLIDDPVKNSEQANSVVDRNKKDVWWRETARTRLEPHASVVMIQTRWHEDDLMGRRLRAMRLGEEAWNEIRLPAVAEEDDPLGRAPGEALWPDRYPLEALEELRTDVGPYGWAALYQQRPQPIEGGIFRAEWFAKRYAIDPEGLLHVPGTRDAMPATACLRFATIDPAIKERDLVEEDAFTAICVWGVAPGGELLLLDVVRRRMSSPDTVAEMQRLYRLWRPTAYWVESVAYQTALIQWARKHGLPCRELEADRDKATRAQGAAPSCAAGRVLLPVNARWLPDFLHELLAAPTGTYWDQIDAFSYGVRVYDDNALASWPLWGAEGAMDKARPAPARPRYEEDYNRDDEREDRPRRPLDDLGGDPTRWRRQPW